MARRKHPHPDQLLTRLLSIRLPESEYMRLEKLASQSDCRSIGELIRRHLAGKPVRVYYRDTTRDNFLEELAAIRQELHLIGININQLTRYFNGSTQPARRVVLAHQTLEAYQQVDRRVGLLLSLIAKLAQPW
ncbi:ribbon-helix-helix protein, CopG family [Pontibacter sp. Tf4]|uniref:plasmid mobilization protein n=1 Tax=Pontibacter sp. Tf4 TaxID=2761620 RepID=UPI001627311B|nr:ribbon-helix-helix protein, CopG family [Pontibacter sp. Tf4]MBB6611804.1 ribbon-helix-helix protein, CopG family [Pontibacter sp. Tf4]